MTSTAESKPNRLSKEKSPYLLQHANNPVDWYPWGAEAFAKAKKEDKPILVSIGYSTCHWCHVMERESYENPEIAALMNQHLVNIKVDREERPDVDKIYMTAVQAMTGQGGWPLNVFLTPDRQPFVGGTYFPPTARGGHAGWGDVVKKIGTSWKDPAERAKMLEAGQNMTQVLIEYAAAASSQPLAGTAELLEGGFKALRDNYDADRGGFGRAPKFPMPVYHFFLARYAARSGDKTAREISFKTLDAMAKGGIYDHLGGGFARYSTDPHWHIPHFEKMLYDNAQLAVNYLEAYQAGKSPEHARIARETLAYILRDMTHPDGGFYSAEDADSLPTPESKEKVEGAFYVWEKKEIVGHLDEKSGPLFCFRYGVRDGGNAAQDPFGEFKNKNILYQAHSIPETAREFKLSEDETSRMLDQAKAAVFEARKKRPRPHLDDKVLSAWNGLMISAFAKGYQVLGDDKYLRAAQKSATFLRANLYDPKTQILFRSYRQGADLSAKAARQGALATADDYAFVTQGLLDLYEADFDIQWLRWAIELTDILNQRFYDKAKGGYFMTSENQDANLIIRVKEDQDNVEPAASSIAALNLLRLAQFTDRADYRDIADKTLQAFGTVMKESPMAMPAMLSALNFALTDPRQIVIVGKPGAPDTQALLKILNNRFIPVKAVIAFDVLPANAGIQFPQAIQAMTPINGKATAYVCEHYVCKKPTNDSAEFEKQLASDRR